MMRIFLLLALFLILYHLVKKTLMSLNRWSRPREEHRQAAEGRGTKHRPPPITDELVKDPVCGMYCPKMESVTFSVKGEIYYFCSNECRDAFVRRMKNERTG